MFDKIENNDTVDFSCIEELEERTDITVEDCGMSGKNIDLRWFVITHLQTGKEKSLYINIRK